MQAHHFRDGVLGLRVMELVAPAAVHVLLAVEDEVRVGCELAGGIRAHLAREPGSTVEESV